MGDVLVSDIYTHNFLHLTGIVILYYDHIVTFSDEHMHIWQNPRSGASWLFFLNRYFAFFANIAVNVGNFSQFSSQSVRRIVVIVTSRSSSLSTSCADYALFRQFVLIISQVIVGANLLLRTYALYGRDKRILIIVLSVAAVLVIMSCWAIVGQKSQISLIHGCHAALSRITAIHIAVAWEALFVYDILIFALTLFKTYRERSYYRPGQRRRIDLVGLIVRDGAIYFAVMACANFANTITFYILQPALGGVLSTFASSISVTMMSRLMLNLHRTASETQYTYTSTAESTTVNSTNLIFTSRVTMPPGDLSTRHPQVAIRHESRAPAHPTRGDIENEEIELVEMHVPYRVGQKTNDDA